MLAALLLTAASVPARAQGQQDFSKVEIKTTKVSSNFYTLDGQGGTIGVLTGPDGVFMVDAQFAPLSEKIVAAIRQISDGRIRYLVNTHVHGDHTGGNENFGKIGVTILARENLRMRLEKPNPGANGAPGVPMPAAGLPVITYDAPITVRMNGEEVRLIPAPVAHTDGDTFVRFTNADVIMTGDFYRSIQYPEHRSQQRRIAAGPHRRAWLRHRECGSEHEDHSGPRPDRGQKRRDRASRHGHRRSRQDRADGQRRQDARAGRRRQADGRFRRESAAAGHDRRAVRRAGLRGAQGGQ